jgi:dsRNA-specific ribonuclease
MERLAFVGDSAINLCIVLYLVLGGNIGKTEEELSTEKTLIIKESNIEAKFKKSGLQNILLQVFETDSTNDSKKSL